MGGFARAFLRPAFVFILVALLSRSSSSASVNSCWRYILRL